MWGLFYPNVSCSFTASNYSDVKFGSLVFTKFMYICKSWMIDSMIRNFDSISSTNRAFNEGSTFSASLFRSTYSSIYLLKILIVTNGFLELIKFSFNC